MGVTEHAIIVQPVGVGIMIPVGQQVENAEGVVRPRPELHSHLVAIGEVDDRVGGSRRRAQRFRRHPESAALDHQCLLSMRAQCDRRDGAAETRSDDDGVKGFLRRCLSRGERP